MDNGMNRRQFLTAAGAAAAGATLGPLVPGPRAYSAEPIVVGFVSIFSGRVASLGETGYRGLEFAIDEINAKGGLLGRQLKAIKQDSAGKIEDAVRVARDFVTRDKVDLLMDHSSSREAFAVREVSRDLKKVTMVTASETTELTADPKARTPYTFRAARQTLHDGIVGGIYAAGVSKAKGMTKWYSASPDYAYGRASTEEFFASLKASFPEMQIVGQAWPKLFEPDYTAFLTKMLQDRPNACYSALWAGDLVTFVEQGGLYGLFDQIAFFGINLADYTILKALKKVPAGMHSGSRYLTNVPDTSANKSFGERYEKKYKELPTNWSQECYTGMQFLAEAVRKAGSTKSDDLVKALEGLTVKAPWGVDGTVTLRKRDHTIVNYAIGWGQTQPQAPWVPKTSSVPWDKILAQEEAYLKSKGWV
ncbi:MAG: ABC transporter substrate-binding protein [Candidatus Rokubacteria bacterium]|nr:ABC transporter substrate-binding protein [Candidatus Rokubacteria bacterium]